MASFISAWALLDQALVFSSPLCFVERAWCEFNSHNWKSVYLHPSLLQNDPKLKTGSVRDDLSWIGLSQDLLLRFIQRKACKAALYIRHVNSKNKYEYDSILCKSYEMDSQEEYLFCKSKKKHVRVQFKRRRPRQSLWFAMKELYSIFTGFCCFGLISFLIHYRWPVHILCFGCIVFFCIVCLQWMNCTACRWFSWILLFLFGQSFSFVFIWSFWSGYSLVVFLVLYRSPCLQCDYLKLRHVQWKTRRAGHEILPRPLFLTWVKDAFKIKPLVMSTWDVLPHCVCVHGTRMLFFFLFFLKPKSFLAKDFKIMILRRYWLLIRVLEFHITLVFCFQSNETY